MNIRPITGFAGEFLRFMLARKRYWLLPLLAIILALGLLVFATQGGSVAPLLYGT